MILYEHKHFKKLFKEEDNFIALSEHQEQDYKIKLKPDIKPTKKPINLLSIEKLKALRTYLNKNIRKGFIQKS